MTTAQPNLPNEVKWVWLILLLIIVVAIITGCTTAEKLLNKAERKDPAIVAKYARDKYPCTDLLKNDTAIIWKDSIIYVDCPDNTNPFEVVIVRTDTVQNTVIQTIRVPVKVQLPSKLVTRWYEDSAKLKMCATELNKTIVAAQKLQADKDRLQDKADRRGKENWIWRAIALCLMAWQGWKIYRKIMIKI